MGDTSNKVRVVVYPSGGSDDALTVKDAMEQVLDYFALLTKADARLPGSNVQVVWRLESASTNSPFTVEARPISSDPEVPIERRAVNAAQALHVGLNQLVRGEGKPIWFDQDAEKVMRRILGRQINGVSRTDFIASEASGPVVLDARLARKANVFLDLKAAEEASKLEDLSRKEHGSIEGQAIGLSTHYAKPALVIRERLSGREVKCVLPASQADEIGAQHQWKDVWGNQRVVVTGVCHFDKTGDLVRIEADSVVKVGGRDVPLSEFQDANFSDGLSPQEHLDLLWGADNG